MNNKFVFIFCIIALAAGSIFFFNKNNKASFSALDEIQTRDLRYAAHVSDEKDPVTSESQIAKIDVVKAQFGSEQVKAALKTMGTGASINESTELQNFFKEAALHPNETLKGLEEELQGLPEHDIPARTNLFGLMMEVMDAIKKDNPSELDAFLHEGSALISKQMTAPSHIEVPIPHGVNPEELTHHGPFEFDSQKLYAQTFQAKFMAMSIYKEAGTETGKRYLMIISRDPRVDPPLRDIADHHAK